jgi:hypothetical protein
MAERRVLRAVDYWKTDWEGCPYPDLVQRLRHADPYPDPRLLVQPGWHADELDRIIAYLRAGREFGIPEDGVSYCRFGCPDNFPDLVAAGVEGPDDCDAPDAAVESQDLPPASEPADMGFRDLFDGVWIWPEGLAHYVERHSVRLPEEFVDHMRSRSWVVPDARVLWEVELEILDDDEETEDHAFWIAWGKRETGGSAG